MTNNPTSPSDSAASPAAAPGPDDPRFGFAHVTQTVGELMAGVTASDGDKPTPCSEFTVKDLLEHIVLVMRRVGALGRGEHWSTVTEQPTDDAWHDDYRAAAHEVMTAWTDSAKLEHMYEVPWGEMPGGPLMYTYTAELAVHGWDLAHATGQSFSIDDELLHGPLMAAKFLPAEGRETPELPFDPVVDPGPDAPVLLQLAGWMGRDVLA